VRTADNSGVEKVEKNSATAVMSISSTKMRRTAISRRGSTPGASQAALNSADSVQVR
jgi:hypothetical protein